MGVRENASTGILFNRTAHVPELRQGTHLGHWSAIKGTEGSLAWNIVDPGAEFPGAIDGGMVPDVARRGAIETSSPQTFGGRVVRVTRVVSQQGVFAGLDIVKNSGCEFLSVGVSGIVVPGGSRNALASGFDISGVWDNRRLDDAIQGKCHGKINCLCKGFDQERVHLGLPFGSLFWGGPKLVCLATLFENRFGSEKSI